VNVDVELLEPAILTDASRRRPPWPESVPETGLGPDVLMLVAVDQARLRLAGADQAKGPS